MANKGRKGARRAARRKGKERDIRNELVSRLSLGKSRRTRAGNLEVGREIGRDRDESAVSCLVDLMQDERYAYAASAALSGCGEEAPSLLLPYSDRFLDYLNSGEEWLVEAAMRALEWVCKHAPQIVWSRREELFAAFGGGSSEVQDAAVKILAALAASSPTRRNHMSPMLVDLLRQCGCKVLPDWTEILYPVLSGRAMAGARKVLEQRLDELDRRQRARVEEIIR